MRAAELATTLRTAGFACFSVALHLSLVVVCVLFATAASSSHASERDLIDIEIQPALGQPHGSDKGKGLGSRAPKPLEPPPAQVHDLPRLPPPDPGAIPTSTAPGPDAAPPSDPSDAGAEAGAASDPDAAFDPTLPLGTENVEPGFGSPDGVPGGQGTSPPKMTPQYAAILSGWFAARFNVHGLSIDPSELSKLSVSVSVSISPDLRVTGFSLVGSSGNPAYDERVRSTMAGIQGSGVSLPPPPEGGPPPASFTTRFRPQNVAR